MAKLKVEYTMKVNNLQKSDDGTAVMSNFTIEGVDGMHRASVTHSINLLPPAEGAGFIEEEDVTQEIAVQWTIAALNAPGKIGVIGAQEEVLKLLMDQKRPQTKPMVLAQL